MVLAQAGLARIRRPHARDSLLAGCLALAAFVLRIYHVTFQPLWSDEVDVIQFAQQPIHNLLANFARPGWNGPLYHLLLHGWFKLAGDSAFALRFLSVLSGTVAVVLTWQMGRRLFGVRHFPYLVILVAGSPYLVWYSQDGKMYSLVFALFVASFLLMESAVRRRRPILWLVYIATVAIGWYVHILFVLVIPAHILSWLSWKRDRRASAILLVLGILLMLQAPQLKWQLPLWRSEFETGHAMIGLVDIIRTEIFSFAVGSRSALQAVAAFLFLAVFIIGCLQWKSQEAGWTALAHFWTPIALIYLISLGMPIYTDRYIITAAFGFYSLCAIGLYDLESINPRLSRLVLVALVACDLVGILSQANLVSKVAPG